jgi:hypothetical protein
MKTPIQSYIAKRWMASERKAKRRWQSGRRNIRSQ